MYVDCDDVFGVGEVCFLDDVEVYVVVVDYCDGGIWFDGGGV